MASEQFIAQNVGLFIVLVSLWTLPWKGYALWLSARNEQKWWFVALLLVNSLAILEIIYIFAVGLPKKRKMGGSSVQS